MHLPLIRHKQVHKQVREIKTNLENPLKLRDMKSKNKLFVALGIFLVLIPLRLPISILLVNLFNYIVAETTETVPISIIATNVIITKIIYNIALSSWFIYTIEILSRNYYGRKANVKGKDSLVDIGCYWWTPLIAIALLLFIIVDAISVYSVFYAS